MKRGLTMSMNIDERELRGGWGWEVISGKSAFLLGFGPTQVEIEGLMQVTVLSRGIYTKYVSSNLII